MPSIVTVPANIVKVRVNLWGAGGGSTAYTEPPGYVGFGGSGAYVTGILLVTPGETLKAIVGLGGSTGNKSSTLDFGGGGGGGPGGASGGGRSAIQRFDGSEWKDIVVAGGGGGASGYNPYATVSSDPYLLYKLRSYGYGGSAGLNSGCDGYWEWPDGDYNVISGSVDQSGAFTNQGGIIDPFCQIMCADYTTNTTCLDRHCIGAEGQNGLGGDVSTCFYSGSGGGGGAYGGAGSCYGAGGGGSSDLSALTNSINSEDGVCGSSSAPGQNSVYYPGTSPGFGGSSTGSSSGSGTNGAIVFVWI